MWPWGHLAVGYLGFLAYTQLTARDWQANHLAGAMVAIVATQLPDLIDKPLAWSFHLLPSGRSLAHSLFAVAFFSVVFWWGVRKYDRGYLTVPFFIGYLSHPIADGWTHLLAGSWSKVTYFLYPLTPAPVYENEGGFISHFASMHFSPYMWVQIGLAFVAIGLFVLIESRAR